MINVDKFTRDFEAALEDVEPNSLSPLTRFREEIESWDSLAALSALAMLDSEYNVQITADEFLKCSTIQDVFELVSTRV